MKFGRKKKTTVPPSAITPAPWKSPDPSLANQLPELLDPALELALREQQLPSIVRPVWPGLWLFPLFSPEACERLMAVIDHRLDWQRSNPQRPPNSMHHAGVVFEPMGLLPAITRIRHRVVNPFAADLFPEFKPLERDYAFSATYGPGLDRRLGFHVDDSDVTLNACLGRSYTGGEVIFQGRRCGIHRQENHRPDEEVRITVPNGHGLLHAGNHRHLVNAVEGERRNLIVWSRSANSTDGQDEGVCPDWCGHQGR